MRTLPPTPSERESSPPWVVVAAVSRVGVGLFAGMYWSLSVGVRCCSEFFDISVKEFQKCDTGVE
jgi:hypothetical protein